MSIAGTISRRIRYAVEAQGRRGSLDSAGRTRAVSPFYDRAVIVKEGYALDGESVSIAMFVDGSVAAYWPDRADDAVRVLQGRLKERIVKSIATVCAG